MPGSVSVFKHVIVGPLRSVRIPSLDFDVATIAYYGRSYKAVDRAVYQINRALNLYSYTAAIPLSITNIP